MKKKNEQALKNLTKAYNQLPEKNIYEKYDYARFLKNNDQFEDAIKFYTEIISKINKNHPLFPKATDGRGVSYERIGEWKKAESDLLLSLKASPDQAYVIHFFTIIIGHLNHSNLKFNYGPLKYIFNNPILHLHHHAHSVPNKFKKGVNFAISLSVWDYIFKTNYVPNSDGNTKLGYQGDHSMSEDFFGQLLYGFKKGD